MVYALYFEGICPSTGLDIEIGKARCAFEVKTLDGHSLDAVVIDKVTDKMVSLRIYNHELQEFVTRKISFRYGDQ